MYNMYRAEMQYNSIYLLCIEKDHKSVTLFTWVLQV